MIAEMLFNKKRNPRETELFITERKLNISLVFIKKSYFANPKYIRINSTHFFYYESFVHSSDIDFK